MPIKNHFCKCRQKKIMAYSYETVVKEEFCDILKYDMKMVDNEIIKKWLDIDGLLNYIYFGWLKIEDAICDEYRNFIFEYMI